MLDSLAYISDTTVRSVVQCADSVFVGGVRVADMPLVNHSTPLGDVLLSPAVQVVMLAAILYYLFVFCRRFGQVVELSSWLVYTSSVSIVEEHSDRHFALSWRVLGLFALGSVAVRLFYKRFVGMGMDVPPLAVVALAVVAMTALWLVPCAVVWIVGQVVLIPGFARGVIAVRRYVVERAGIYLTPFVVGYALSGLATNSVLWYIIASISTIVLLLYAFKLLKMFVDARFSIFYWILYLCAVEIFPMSLIVVVMLGLL